MVRNSWDYLYFVDEGLLTRKEKFDDVGGCLSNPCRVHRNLI